MSKRWFFPVGATHRDAEPAKENSSRQPPAQHRTDMNYVQRHIVCGSGHAGSCRDAVGHTEHPAGAGKWLMRRAGAPRQRCADSRRLIANGVWCESTETRRPGKNWFGWGSQLVSVCPVTLSDTEGVSKIPAKCQEAELQERSGRFRSYSYKGGNKCLR